MLARDPKGGPTELLPVDTIVDQPLQEQLLMTFCISMQQSLVRYWARRWYAVDVDQIG